MAKERNLPQKTTLTTSDFIRVVGSDNASYKQLVSDVAKKIIENYTGSSLAGSSQSVKSALDSLNSKMANNNYFYSSGTINTESFSVTLPSDYHAGIYAVNVNGSGNEVGWWQLAGTTVTLQPLSPISRISATVSGTTITFTKTSGTSIRDIVLIIA